MNYRTLNALQKVAGQLRKVAAEKEDKSVYRRGNIANLGQYDTKPARPYPTDQENTYLGWLLNPFRFPRRYWDPNNVSKGYSQGPYYTYKWNSGDKYPSTRLVANTVAPDFKCGRIRSCQGAGLSSHT